MRRLTRMDTKPTFYNLTSPAPSRALSSDYANENGLALCCRCLTPTNHNGGRYAHHRYSLPEMRQRDHLRTCFASTRSAHVLQGVSAERSNCHHLGRTRHVHFATESFEVASPRDRLTQSHRELRAVLRRLRGRYAALTSSRGLLGGVVAPDVGAKLGASYLTIRDALDFCAPLVRNLTALAPFGYRWRFDPKRLRKLVLRFK